MKLTQIPGFPQYAATRNGDIWSCKRGRWKKLKPRVNAVSKPGNLPYLMVALYVDGRRRDLSIHSLVLETFVGSRGDGMVGCHINGDCQDNRVENLRWGTHSSNCLDKAEHGTHARGERGRCASVSDEVAKRIKERYGPKRGRGARGGGPTIAQVADEFGVTSSVVSSVVAGRRYAHV